MKSLSRDLLRIVPYHVAPLLNIAGGLQIPCGPLAFSSVLVCRLRSTAFSRSGLLWGAMDRSICESRHSDPGCKSSALVFRHARFSMVLTRWRPLRIEVELW